jgi:hypothetical protein
MHVNSLARTTPPAKIEVAYHNAHAAIQRLVDLVATWVRQSPPALAPNTRLTG